MSPELETAVVRQISRTYNSLNNLHFDGQLRRPVIGISDNPRQLGRWKRETRALSISRRLYLEHGWGVLVEVLKHEMAHQYVDEVLRMVDETAHGPAFRRICEQHGIDHRACGLPRSGAVVAERDRVLERVSKLLELARSANLNEAHTAMNAAQRLMLKHNLQVADTGTEQAYSFRHLGEPTGRIQLWARILAGILADHFFVEAIWVTIWQPLQGKPGSVLEVCGSRENLEIAAYTHAFLVDTAERLWQKYKKERALGGNRDRRSFIAGVMSGFREKLDAQENQCRGQALVWKGDPALQQFFSARHPRVRTRHYETRLHPAAHRDGREAGKRIVLRPAIKPGQSERVRLLKPENG